MWAPLGPQVSQVALTALWDHVPSLPSGWEDLHTLLLVPISGGQGGKHHLTVVWDHVWVLQPGCALLGGRRALSTLPLGIYHQIKAADRARLLILSKKPICSEFDCSSLGWQVHLWKVPAHMMLRCNNGCCKGWGQQLPLLLSGMKEHVLGAWWESSTAGGSWSTGLSLYPPGHGSEGFHDCEVFGYPDLCLWQSSLGPWGVAVKDAEVCVACSAFNTAPCVSKMILHVCVYIYCINTSCSSV